MAGSMQIDRRSLIKKGAAAGAVAWTAPAIIGSMATPAAACSAGEIVMTGLLTNNTWQWRTDSDSSGTDNWEDLPLNESKSARQFRSQANIDLSANALVIIAFTIWWKETTTPTATIRFVNGTTNTTVLDAEGTRFFRYDNNTGSGSQPPSDLRGFLGLGWFLTTGALTGVRPRIDLSLDKAESIVGQVFELTGSVRPAVIQPPTTGSLGTTVANDTKQITPDAFASAKSPSSAELLFVGGLLYDEPGVTQTAGSVSWAAPGYASKAADNFRDVRSDKGDLAAATFFNVGTVANRQATVTAEHITIAERSDLGAVLLEIDC